MVGQANGPLIQLNLDLPLMKPSRFERWLNQARAILSEFAFRVDTVVAAKSTDTVRVRIEGQGNCWTYDFDQPHITALQAILGSNPKKEVEGLVHGCLREQMVFEGYDQELSLAIKEGLVSGVRVGIPC